MSDESRFWYEQQQREQKISLKRASALHRIKQEAIEIKMALEGRANPNINAAIRRANDILAVIEKTFNES